VDPCHSNPTRPPLMTFFAAPQTLLKSRPFPYVPTLGLHPSVSSSSLMLWTDFPIEEKAFLRQRAPPFEDPPPWLPLVQPANSSSPFVESLREGYVPSSCPSVPQEFLPWDPLACRGLPVVVKSCLMRLSLDFSADVEAPIEFLSPFLFNPPPLL